MTHQITINAAEDYSEEYDQLVHAATLLASASASLQNEWLEDQVDALEDFIEQFIDTIDTIDTMANDA